MVRLTVNLYYYLWNPNDDNPAYQALAGELLGKYGIKINPIQVPWVIPNTTDKPLHVLLNLEELLADSEGNYEPNPLRNQPYPDLIRMEPGFYYTDLKNNGILQPMDDYLKEYGPSLYHDLKNIQDTEESAIFDIPVRSGRYPSCWIIREDIRKKLGVPEIRDTESLITFLKTAKSDPEYNDYNNRNCSFNTR
jgi:ABC-type glycerol-3-phosphate transport system substrate-binding protein